MKRVKRWLPLLFRKNEKPKQEILFFLNTLPRKKNAKYVVLADGIIEADKIWMA